MCTKYNTLKHTLEQLLHLYSYWMLERLICIQDDYDMTCIIVHLVVGVSFVYTISMTNHQLQDDGRHVLYHLGTLCVSCIFTRIMFVQHFE